MSKLGRVAPGHWEASKAEPGAGSSVTKKCKLPTWENLLDHGEKHHLKTDFIKPHLILLQAWACHQLTTHQPMFPLTPPPDMPGWLAGGVRE